MSNFTVEEWVQKIGNADATHLSDAQTAATVILEELRLYGVGDWASREDHLNKVREDMNTLANALVAFAKLYVQYGVKP